SIRIGAYLAKQKLLRRKYFPLVLELEPLFACNLSCTGCGKIQHPASVLKQRMSVADALAAVKGCGAPVAAIAGRQPLMHPQIHELVNELVRRKKFVILCTNALLLRKKLDKFTPSPYFTFVLHVDGLADRHDAIVEKPGTFDECVEAFRAAK